MKLATYVLADQPDAPPRLGAVQCDPGSTVPRYLVDLRTAEQAFNGGRSGMFDSMLAWLESGPAAVERTQQLVERAAGDLSSFGHPIESVHLLAPLPRPRSIRDCLVFEGHWIQVARRIASGYVPLLGQFDALLERTTGRSFLRPPRVWYERPLYYKGNPASVVGPDADVRWPAYSEQLDFELELGAIIGRQGRDLSVDEAQHHIAGFVIFNDFSARDVQRREMAGRLGPAKSKDFDTGNAIGPWLTTADEWPGGLELWMEARVNGECWSRASTADMQFTFAEIVSYVSQGETLYPGDFIGSGTPRGGCGWELDRWLQPGDIVELEVERLGVLRSRIVRD